MDDKIDFVHFLFDVIIIEVFAAGFDGLFSAFRVLKMFTKIVPANEIYAV